MFRRIIVAFDGSDRSLDALALAQRLRDPDGGVLVLASVVETSPWHLPRHGRGSTEPVHEEVALRLAGARARIPTGIPARLRSPEASSAARGLTVLAESEAADLIVIGSSRHGTSGSISLERTAGRLLNGAPCAVAVAPVDARESDPFRHVGIAYDGSPEADTALAAGYSVAAGSGAAVTLLTALPHHGGVSMPDGFERSDRLARLAAQERLDAAADTAPPGVNPRTLLLFGRPGEVIDAVCDGIVDLLVVGSRGYGPVERALMGSVSSELTEGARHPVLVLPRRRAAAPERLTPLPAPAEA